MNAGRAPEGPSAAATPSAYEKLCAALAAGRRVSREELAAFLSAAAAAYGGLADEGRDGLRARLGRLEQLLARGAYFGEADAAYRLRLDFRRRDYVAAFRDRRDLPALARAAALALWRATSCYGTSILRLVWTTCNVAFWFAVVYFLLDLAAVRFAGRRAFVAPAMISPGSYFIIGFEGLFPGTAAFLANTFWAQLALAVENGVGAILLVSLVSLAARRGWRGFG